MSEQKQPMAGEWWWLEEVIYIVGYTASGNFIIEFADGKTDLCWPLRACEFETWQHLPDCTGFNWHTEPEEPADDWVILDPVIYADHVPRDGVDEFYDCKQWRDHTQRHLRSTVGEFAAVSISSRVRCRRSHLPALPVSPTTRTIKLCSVVYWDRPEAPMSTILTEQELERHRKAWRTMHVVSETTVEVPL